MSRVVGWWHGNPAFVGLGTVVPGGKKGGAPAFVGLRINVHGWS